MYFGCTKSVVVKTQHNIKPRYKNLSAENVKLPGSIHSLLAPDTKYTDVKKNASSKSKREYLLD